MKFKLTHNNKILTLLEATQVERKQLEITLTKQIEHYKYLKSDKKKHFNGVISYLYQKQYVPVGLWKEVMTMCKKFNFPIEIEGFRTIFRDFNKDEFIEWIDWKFSDSELYPRWYQIDAAYNILKYNLSLTEVATGGGKSLIIFIVFSYMLEKGLTSRTLMIVPNIGLVIQAYEDFLDYNSKLSSDRKTNLQMKQIHGGEDKNFTAEKNLFIGTYQSLINFNDNLFLAFDSIAVDETHRAKGQSIQTIISKCKNANTKYGVTGTVPKQGTLDWLTLNAYLGPLVTTIDAKTLMDEGHISKLEVNVIEMTHEDSIIESYSYLGNRDDLLSIEQDIAIKSKKRTSIITKLVGNYSKNQIVLFYRIEYGKELFRSIKEKYPNKTVYFIDGSIDGEDRNTIKTLMEDGEDKVLVASYGTLSTGISIKNIHYIHLTESFRSDVIIRQSIGRGLRLHSTKDKLIVFDYVDKYTNSNNKNLLLLQGIARQGIYAKQQYPYNIKRIKL